jgi:hypothetical protein
VLYRSVPKNKWVLPQPPVRCVADTAGTEANHRPDAGQQESATRFRRAVCIDEERGGRAVPALAVVCLLGGCTALAACRYGVLVLVRARLRLTSNGRRSELLPRCLTSHLCRHPATTTTGTLQALVFDAHGLVAGRCHLSLLNTHITIPPIARCDLRNDPSGDLR